MKKILFAFAASAALLSACNEAVNVIPVEYGTIIPSVPMVIDQIETKVAVNGTSGTSYTIDEWNIQVIKGTEVKYNNTIAAYGAEQTFATGEYTVAVQNVSETLAQPTDGLGVARFYGDETVTVLANQDNLVTVPCAMVNSKFSVNLTGFDVFESYSIAVTAGTREYTFKSANKGDVVFFNVKSGDTLVYTLTAEFDGNSKTYTNASSPVSVAAAKWYKLNFTVSETDGTIVPDVTIDDACEEINENIPVNPYK